MFSSVEKILCFQHSNQSYFLLSFAGQNVLYFGIHHCLLLERKIRNQKFSSVLKAKGEFLANIHAISLNKGHLNTPSHLC